MLSDQKKKVARELIMTAVSQLAETAKEFKVKNEDQKLTSDQKQTLMNNAIANAQVIGKNTGIDVIKTLGPEGAQLAVSLAVKTLKSVVEKKTPKLSAEVEKLLPCLLLGVFCLTGCVTNVPKGWETANAQVVNSILEITNGALDSAELDDKDYFFTLGQIAATAYDAAALSMQPKSVKLLYAIIATKEFADLLQPKRDPITLLRKIYGNSKASETELWTAFVIHQVRQLRQDHPLNSQ